MSYEIWTTQGFGFCVDNINTTPEKLLKLAAMEPSVDKIVKDYIEGLDIPIDELTVEDFDDLEGEYCERGITYILYNVISEIPIVFADDYNGTPYILYCPSYPWYMDEKERTLSQDDVKEIFKKYIKILTDENIRIDYYNVENGG